MSDTLIRTDGELLEELAEAEGYQADIYGVTSMLEASILDSVVPGICTCCYGTQDCEPDARANWCEECETNSVKSCLVLAGLI